MDRIEAERIFTPAAREAIDAFPICPGEVALAAVGENITFRVTDARDGAAFVLRLHRPGYNSLAELKSERAWTTALRGAGVAAPAGVAAKDGRAFVEVAIAALDERRHAGVTRWTQGEVLAKALEGVDELPRLEAAFRQLGAIAAAIHNQSSVWTAPAGFVRRALDAEGLMGEAPCWGRFWEHPALSPSERRILEAARGKIAQALARLGRQSTQFSLIHADLHPGNVLIGEEGLSVIDFDDAAHGWHAYELAVALVSQHHHPGFAAIQAAMLSGYREGRAFSAASEALLPMFLLIRQMALIGWLYQRPEIDPGERLTVLAKAACARCAVFEPPC